MNILLKFILNLSSSLYQSILKLSINASQLIAYWRTRVRRDRNASRCSAFSSTNEIQLTPGGDPSTRSPESLAGVEVKTPRLLSLLRRLSIRNFMEYCITAINEASSSSCSNKFDLIACEGPIWLLGRLYDLPQDAEKVSDDIVSKIWITYRKNFPPIDDRYTTDRGFGCMIRCGQMVLANALVYKCLGRDWIWRTDSNPSSYFEILRLFQDKEESPYSIHKIVDVGQHEGKNIGEWFGPNTIAQALKRIAMSRMSGSGHVSVPSGSTLEGTGTLISIDAALDNVVVIDEIKSRFMSRDKWLPGVLFIQLRLGLTKMNPLYFNALRKSFRFKNSLGIIGGRPNHALYLIGYTNDDIIYLDPHSTQQYIDLDSTEDGIPDDLTYHCACPEKMSIDRLDPSLALCFYFQDENDFDSWCAQSQEQLINSEQAPMFEITKSRPSGWQVPQSTKEETGSTQQSKDSNEGKQGSSIADTFEDLDSKSVDKNNCDSHHSNDSEEFEMLD